MDPTHRTGIALFVLAGIASFVIVRMAAVMIPWISGIAGLAAVIAVLNWIDYATDVRRVNHNDDYRKPRDVFAVSFTALALGFIGPVLWWLT